MKTLEELRKEIDALDHELLNILEKRFAVVKQIGAIKKEHGLSFLDEERWKEVLESKLAKARNLGLSEDFIKKMYEFIHEHALEVEKK